MTARASKTMVGAFVLLGLLLFTIGIVALGGGKLFNESLEYTLYFDGSVSGLSIGAPVVFRGVPLGSVTKISLVANSRDSNVTIPVSIRIDDRSFIRPNGQTLSEAVQAEVIHRMVERGLRARLQMGSLITGQYRIELDFFPNTPMNFKSSDPNSEIPTIPSPIDTLQRLISRIPMDDIANSLTLILHNITDAVGDGQLKQAIAEITGTFRELRSLFADGGPLVNALQNSMAQVEKATKSFGGEVPAAFQAFQNAMNGLARAAEQLRKVGNSAEYVIGRESPTMNDLRRLLQDAASAARSLRNFADMLERNPEALLKGRHGSR